MTPAYQGSEGTVGLPPGQPAPYNTSPYTPQSRPGDVPAEASGSGEGREDGPFGFLQIRTPALAMSPDGKWVATGGDELHVRPVSGNFDWHRAFASRVVAVAFSPEGRRIAVGTQDGGVSVASLPGTDVTLPLFVGKSVESLAFSPDGNSLAVATEEHVSLFNVKGSLVLARRTLNNSVSGGYCVRYSPKGDLFAVANGNIDFWDSQTAKHLRTIHPPDPATSLDFSRHGSELVVGSKVVSLWNAKTGSWKELFSIIQQLEPIRSVAFSPSGNKIAFSAGQEDIAIASAAKKSTGTVIGVFDLQTRKFSLNCKTDLAVPAVCFSPDGKTFIAAKASGDALLYSVSNEELVRTLDHEMAKP